MMFARGNAQTFATDYTTLKSKSPIPNSILTSTAQKSHVDIAENLGKAESRKFQKKKTTFIIQTNYLLDQVLKGDLLLFNTSLNRLVDRVGLQLMGDEIAADGVHFFIIKSSAVNAFSTDRGDIFITLGLLARLETESELAFVLGHELTHYQLKHSMNTFVQHDKLEQDHRRVFRESVGLLVAKSNYSKELELTADKEGVVLLEKAGYNLQGAVRLLNVLKYAHTVIYQDTVEKDFFETNYFRIDSSDWATTIEEIKELDDENKYSSHPNTSDRIEKISNQFLDFDRAERKEFITWSRTAFDSLVLVAQFELVDVLLKEQNYQEAIYNSLTLMKRYPNNAFLQKSSTYGLYGLAQYALLQKKNAIKEDRTSQGNWGAMVGMFDQLYPKEIGILAAIKCWEAHHKYPKDEKIKLMAKDMIEDLVIYEIEKPFEYFKKVSPQMDSEALELHPLALAFTDYLDDPEFRGILEDGIKYRKRWLKNKKENEDIKKKKAKERKEQLRGKSLGLKKVVALNPFYIVGKVTKRKGAIVDYLKSEERQIVLNKLISEVSASLNLNTVILDINALQRPEAIDEYNDIQVIQLWGDELFKHPDYIVATNHNEAMQICDKYETGHFIYPGIVSFHSSVGRGLRFLELLLYSRGLILLTYVTPATLPGALYLSFRKNNELFYSFLAFDVRNYRLELNNQNQMKLKDRNEVVKSNLYWSMNQLKRKKKK